MAGRSLRRTRARLQDRRQRQRRDPENPTRMTGKRCWVIQLRDGSLLRDPKGHIYASANLEKAHAIVNSYLQRLHSSYMESLRIANYPQVVRAFNCETSKPTVHPEQSRPRPTLTATDETALRLLARARQSAAAREVAHDYLMIHYPAYVRAVNQAGRQSREWRQESDNEDRRHDQFVYVRPGGFAAAVRHQRATSSRTSAAKGWQNIIMAAPDAGWVRGLIGHFGGERAWIPLFRVPAARPNTRTSRAGPEA